MDRPRQSAESMAKRVMRFDDLKVKGIPIMFIDSLLPGHYRMNYAVIGDTASENPDYAGQRAILEPHQFQIGMGFSPPGNGPAWHTHDYVESFFILKGPWRFYWGNDPDPEQPDGYIDLNEWDMISLPPGVYRSFEYIGTEIGWFFAVLEAHQVFTGKDPIWPPTIEAQAAAMGYQADENGKMVQPPRYAADKAEHYQRLLDLFKAGTGVDLKDYQPPK